MGNAIPLEAKVLATHSRDGGQSQKMPHQKVEGTCSCVVQEDRTGNTINQPVTRSVKDNRCYPVYSSVYTGPHNNKQIVQDLKRSI
jgi:hypothetical protein